MEDEQPLRMHDVGFDVALLEETSVRHEGHEESRARTCSISATHMHSTSSMSSVGSSNAIRAATRSAWSERVGGPVGGRGEPFVRTNNLFLLESAQPSQWVRDEKNARPSSEVAPANRLELLPQEEVVAVLAVPELPAVELGEDDAEVALLREEGRQL